MTTKRRPWGTRTREDYLNARKAHMLSYKYYAKRAVAEAIRKNMMSPAREFACTACPLMDPPNDPPNQAQLYHHLLGYEPENWLEVQPLCRGCHEFLHPKDE